MANDKGMEPTRVLTPKSKRRIKAGKVKLENVQKILHTFNVDGVQFNVGDDVQTIPPHANFDFLLRRGAISVKDN
jgi:hypothetical protein